MLEPLFCSTPTSGTFKGTAPYACSHSWPGTVSGRLPFRTQDEIFAPLFKFFAVRLMKKAPYLIFCSRSDVEARLPHDGHVLVKKKLTGKIFNCFKTISFPEVLNQNSVWCSCHQKVVGSSPARCCAFFISISFCSAISFFPIVTISW